MNNLMILILAILVALFFAQLVKNHAIALEEAVKNAISDMKVQQKRRMDLIYNLVDCVKHYDAHEAEVLSMLAKKMSANVDADGEMKLHSTLNATAYRYPELAGSALYKELMNELSMTENLMARHRENYNAVVNDYMRFVQQFPADFLLPILGYQKKKFAYLEFEVSSDAPQNLFEERGGEQ
jgi:LemA protein